ncbi:MAG: class A beta-lactamase-related serine hydrolase [Gemmatimonadota bacterium]|nr:class A beta-lactamase-related serine hydrolase [Gemmatimonadota bacterium]MDQ6873355.1 class A beta-lactamase-related serine hydrolase [Gemmatimonadota bacterium]
MTKTETPAATRERALRTQIESIEKESGARAIAVALHDAETGLELHYKADRWFHAASTIKVPILLGVFAAIDRGDLLPHSRVHVRNRFLSVVENIPFRVESGRDANSGVHNAIGKMMRVDELAYHMITTSSNLATNLLLGVIGPDSVNRTLKELDVDDGIELKRGVEDELAFEKGINNNVTAEGLLRILVLLSEGKAFSPALSRRMMDILHGQEFNQGIPARLPKGARVAHKTGEISTVAHDAGVVYLPKRKPYVLVILTEWDPSGSGRSRTIAAISHTIYEFLTRGPVDE